ncbi:MAG: oligosaccharide flippase family protein [Candidatus Acidiferrales bacterium]
MNQPAVGFWTLKSVGSRIAGLRRSHAFRDSASNATYGLIEYATQPVLIVLSAPFLVSRLGFDQYGIWMLVNAFTGTVGIFHVGLGDATIKYISAYRGRNDLGGVRRILSGTLALSALFGCLAAVALYFAAPLLVEYVFKIAPAHYAEATQAIEVGSLILFLQAIYQVFASALKAYEAFGPPSKIAVFVKSGTIVGAVVLVAFGFGIVAILLLTAAFTLAGVVAQALETARILGVGSFWPAMDRRSWKEVLGFGCYSWVQNAAGVAFNQSDRLLIAAMLGTTPLAYYTLCVQIAQQVHGLATGAFGFLFPHISARQQSGNKRAVRRVFRLAVLVNLAFAVVLALPLVIFGRGILALWMGSAFAGRTHVVLAVLAVAFCALSINVAPHFTLLGLGKVRFVSLMNVLGGALSLGAAALLIPPFGLLGAAAGRLFYGPAISMNFVKVARSI